MSPNQKPEPIQSDTDSVETATPLKFHLPPDFDTDLVSVLCTNCKSKNEHEFTLVRPVMEILMEGFEPDHLENLKRTRRLKICTFCGHLSMTT